MTNKIIDDIIIVPLRNIPYDYAKLEIIKYIKSVESKEKKVYISEIAEELKLDIELIKKIMENISLIENKI